MGGRSWGTIALCTWLFLEGLILASGMTFDGRDLAMGVIAILAAILLIAGK